MFAVISLPLFSLIYEQHFDIPINIHHIEENVPLERVYDANIHKIVDGIQYKFAHHKHDMTYVALLG